jgi:ribose transport system permease protein
MSALEASPAGAFPLRRITGRLWNTTGRSPAWPLLILLSVFFASQSPLFLTSFNINVILNQTVFIGVLAIGLTPLAISGNIDLSVGAIAALATCVAVIVQGWLGFVPSVLAALLVSTLVGLLNGLIVEKLGLNSIIVTLAMGTALHGLTYIVFGTATTVAPGSEYLDLGYLKIAGVSLSVILFIAMAIGLAALLRFTVHGVHTFAIGGNRKAALDAGVDVQKHVLANFCLSGFIAGICGILLVASLGAGSAILAKDYELWAIIAVVLGGTALRGGAGTISGTVAAAISLTALRNGMNLMKIDVRWFLVVLGLSLIVALALDRLRSGEPENAE